MTKADYEDNLKLYNNLASYKSGVDKYNNGFINKILFFFKIRKRKILDYKKFYGGRE